MGLYVGETIVSGGGGTSPFEAAKKAGYTGTEEEFNQLLAIIPSAEEQAAWDAKMDALDYTPANEVTEEARPANRLTSADGGTTISVESSAGLSVVQTLEAITQRGVYTLYVSKGCTDNPPGAEAIKSSLRGIAHITLTKAENGYMYAWILLFDKEGNMYTRYTSNSESAWVSYAKASDVIALSEKGVSGGVATLGEDGKVLNEQLPDMSVDAYTKAQSLTNATAAQFGLDSTAVPDDVLSWIGKYNEHWWSLLHGEAYSYTEYVEKKTDIAARIQVFDGYDVGNGTEFTISWSTSASYDADGVHLNNPTTKTYTNSRSSTGVKNLYTSLKNDLASLPIPCYLLVSTYAKAIFLPTGSTVEFRESSYYNATLAISKATSDDYYIDMYLGYGSSVPVSAQIVTSEAQIIQVPAGETTYEHSTDRNAYPDSGTVDGITYTYLGCPFEKFPTISSLRIESGSYIGTGTYGKDAPNSLRFSMNPQFIFITKYGASASSLLTRSNDTFSIEGAAADCHVTWLDYGITWYTTQSSSITDNSIKQLNGSKYTYNYIALG